MKKWFMGMAALAAAMCFGATTEDGVTKERRGALGPNDTVVTDVDATGIVTARTYTKDEVDRRIATNAPVRSVNGKTGRVVLGAGDVGALPNNRDGLKANANFRNAVWDVQIKPGGANEGAARVLPPYLHEIEFDSTYPADAAWYYAHADYSDAGMCSVRRAGNVIERNFDWKFDFMPEFVLRTTAAEGRFASLGIASVGKLLTEMDVISGKWSPYYRCLPGHTVDGMNEKGVFCGVNVVDGDPDWDNPGGDIHPLGGVRWVLDYGTNAQQAAEALASRIAFPAGWSQNFHYLVADKDGTWIVENGAAHEVAGTAVMTNFKLYPSRDTDGAGQERYNLLADGEPITNAWWTLAYLAKTSPVRVSDIGTDTNAIFAAWAYGDRESHRGQAAGGKTWWQTVHTAVYDLDDLSLRVCVQEVDDWYVFAVPSAGGVKPDAVKEIVEPMIAAHHDETKLDTYGKFYWVGDAGVYLKFFAIFNPNYLQVGSWSEIALKSGYPLSEELDGKQDKITASGVLKGDGSGNVTAATPSSTGGADADYRDPKDAKCYETEYTQWTFSPPLEDGFIITNEEDGVYLGGWIFVDEIGRRQSLEKGNENSWQVEWSAREWEGGYDITATRQRVATKDETFVTQSFVTNEVATAISTNNPAFVSAVRDTPAPEPGQGEDPPWGTYGTVGAAIAGLVAALKLTVKKIKCGTLEVTPTNGVAELDDFFSESNSLLMGVVRYPINAAATVKDRAINVVTDSPGVTVPDDFTDLLIRASVTNTTSLPVTMPDAITTVYGDNFPGETGEFLVTITKTGAAEAYVRTIKLEVLNV